MAVKKICEVCGKEYETCRPIRITEPFRWQEVACCKEHGSIYFEKNFGPIYDKYLEKIGEKKVPVAATAAEEPEEEAFEEAHEFVDEIGDEDEDLDDDEDE